MDTKLEGYIRFFEDQIKENELEYTRYLGAPLYELFQSDNAFCGQITGYNAERGHLTIKLRKNHAPRLKISKTFCVLRGPIWDDCGSNPYKWSISCKSFLETAAYHTSFSEIKPLYFQRINDPEYDYIGCSAISLDLYQAITRALDEKRVVWFIMVENFPPTQYLQNLVNYIQRYPDDPNLLLEPKISYDNWYPEELTYEDNIAQRLVDTLASDSICILQGPPGTGKSYTIAQVIAKYLSEKKTVCVTTMSNKGLTELIEKEHLNKFREDGCIYKTLLTADEQKSIPGTKFANKDVPISGGELLCMTNYILSSQFKTAELRQAEPLYDLIVIEEASQAYLTAIAAFSRLGKHCLIVGDPMQLPPIVLSPNKPEYADWKVDLQANGLRTCALGSTIKSYRITTTHRLTPASSQLTGVFYSNNLRSVKKQTLDWDDVENKQYFPAEGGCLLFTTKGATDAVCSSSALRTMETIVSEFQSHYPKRSIAIISPFRESVQRLQKQFYHEHQSLDITVETIDRIQGMTVDYAILYFPLRNVSFALTENRFNVATSRSLSTTLVISDMPIEGFATTSAKVAAYLSGCSVLHDSGLVESRQMSQITKPDDKKALGVKVVGYINLSKFERPKKMVNKSSACTYIIDTNVFVECPDIISRISSENKIVLSAKVVDELDTMKIKLDDEGKQNAQVALLNINRFMEKREIKMECSDMSLLPGDFKKSPDNMILSVVLKYKEENPILLTSDNGLQIKAKGLNIPAVSLREFMKSNSYHISKPSVHPRETIIVPKS